MGERAVDLIPVGARRPGAWVRLASVGMIALLAGCATGYGGGYGGYPDGAYPGGAYPGSYPDRYGSERMLATVQHVDPGSGRLILVAESGGYGGASQVEVQFDRSTRLFYRGQQYPVEGLERGDRISVDVQRSGSRLWARSIEVVRNVRESGGGGYYGDGYGNALNGAVGYVDPRRRVIEMTSGGYSGRREQVFYDERTRVSYRGQVLRPEQLQAGDIIRVQARPSNGGWYAEHIEVEVNARSR